MESGKYMFSRAWPAPPTYCGLEREWEKGTVSSVSADWGGRRFETEVYPTRGQGPRSGGETKGIN